MKKKLLILVIAFSALGILNSSYLAYLHYADSGTALCTDVDVFACDIVNKSTFSELTGIFRYFGLYVYLPIPVSIMGLCFFVVIFGMSIMLTQKKTKLKRKDLLNALFYLSLSGTLFGLFLIYIQAFVLRALCLFCLIMDIILFLTLILSYVLKNHF